jgi:hypothetical protein
MARLQKADLDRRSDTQAVDTLLLVFLTHFPSAIETTNALEDLLWALMNKREFLMGAR